MASACAVWPPALPPVQLAKIYTNRDSFDFGVYIAALLRPPALVPQLQEEVPGVASPATWPQAIFVASDSTRTSAELKRERADHVDKQWEARKSGAATVMPPLPPFLTVPDTRGRFLSEYGSHTVAGGYGICMKTRCGLPLKTMQRYDAEIDANGPSRAPRMLGVVFDAAEDLHLLSRCSRVVTTAASRYGVIAVALGWAATGGASVPGTAFVDAKSVESGELQSGWIHWADPGLKRGVPGEQWVSFSRMLVEGLWTAEGEARSGAVGLPAVGAELPPPRLIGLRSFIPAVPPELLWPEVLRWSGERRGRKAEAGGSGAEEARVLGTGGGLRVWPGECPAIVGAGSSAVLAVAAQINAGMRHLAQNHVAQVSVGLAGVPSHR